jgi:hypothetical protein
VVYSNINFFVEVRNSPDEAESRVYK